MTLLDRLMRWALYYSTQMIHQANNRSDALKGDPKVGGHPAACASSTHILGALHLLVREPQDYFSIKPHASPMDHAYSHLLGLFFHPDGIPFTQELAKRVMFNLRKFKDPENPDQEPVFQSYHAVWDPDSFHYLPSGSVGIPPVVSAYLALAYRFALHHGFDIPKGTHFWSLTGDSEFREGSLAECIPDAAERGLHNVTWIIDYNRQNLDGTRIINEEGFHGTDSNRIEAMAKANGWNVIQARHGGRRESFFKKPGGENFRKILEKLSDYELQALLLRRDGEITKNRFLELDPKLKPLFTKLNSTQVLELLEDLGGHDIELLVEIYKNCRTSKQPTLVIAHTIKGWGLECQAVPGNHSMLATEEEIEKMQKFLKIPKEDLFQLPPAKSEENIFCHKRGEELRKGIQKLRAHNTKNQQVLAKTVQERGEFPKTFNINLKLTPWANTQWMWGQLAAKLTRIANEKPTTPQDKAWELAATHLITMAPDVGTSTNLTPSMDGKIYGPESTENFESRYQVKDRTRLDLLPLEKQSHRHLRFEIEEGNAMSCVGAFGKMKDLTGIPILPFMTVYDFFIKRALDQFFYNLYWKSSFILVGTPSGVTLSPEGAQHSWKSDLQIPNGITWEPAFAIEMDWILSDSIRRHFTNENQNREGVLIRAVTRGLEQKVLLERLSQQVRFQNLSEQEVLEKTRQDSLQGGYWLVNFEGTEGYAPGDNVVNLFVQGALVPEAVAASDQLREEGIFANIAIVCSPDLLIGTLGKETQYSHLRQTLNVNSNLYINSTKSIKFGIKTSGQIQVESAAEFLSIRGSRIPIVAICDGEPGLLDNIGSIVGVPQETLAVRKHSKSGRPIDVYEYHHLDPKSIAEASIKMLEQAASEEILVKPSILEDCADQPSKETFVLEEDTTQTRH